VFTDYSDDELVDIFKAHSKLMYPNVVINYIIDISGRNPRIMIKTFIDTLKMHYRSQINIPNDTNTIIATIDKLFGITGGLNRVSIEYLDTLKKLGGKASVNVLAATTKLDINTMKYQVEPALLYKGLIKITSKGRELI
jgi:Holliday junction resolvasome RuvABC ATP-dependent DNA helicase subunit